jgi:hypothetical protein
MFKIPNLFQWSVVVTDSKHIEDIYKAPDNALSIMKAIEDVSSISESCSVCTSAHRPHRHFKLNIRSALI